MLSLGISFDANESWALPSTSVVSWSVSTTRSWRERARKGACDNNSMIKVRRSRSAFILEEVLEEVRERRVASSRFRFDNHGVRSTSRSNCARASVSYVEASKTSISWQVARATTSASGNLSDAPSMRNHARAALVFSRLCYDNLDRRVHLRSNVAKSQGW